MKSLKIKEIANAIGADIVCGMPNDVVTRVSHDSRDAGSDALFFCLIGEKNDAHKFIPDVVEAGCTHVVISDIEALRPVTEKGVTALFVRDTKKALQDLAAWYLKEIGVTVIGVTGSVGKTTTKDMLTAICSQKYRTSATKGNYNSDIGLPLTALSLEEGTEVAVLEMGMDRPGQIDLLAKIARPKVAVITTIGSAHLEFFGKRENILKAKMEISNYLGAADSLVVNTDCDLLKPENVRGGYQLITAGRGMQNDYRISDVKNLGEEGFEFTLTNMWRSERFRVPVAGIHNAGNAAIAIAAAAQLNVTMSEAAKGLAGMVLTANRLSYVTNGKIKVLDDTYNASPESMRAAIDQLVATEGGKKIAVLGDMYELGEDTADIHQSMGEYAVGKGVDLVVGVGELGQLAAASAGTSGIMVPTKEKAVKVLKQTVKDGDVILVKASHAMDMGKIVQALIGE